MKKRESETVKDFNEWPYKVVLECDRVGRWFVYTNVETGAATVSPYFSGHRKPFRDNKQAAIAYYHECEREACSRLALQALGLVKVTQR